MDERGRTKPVGGVLRRTILQASAVAAGALAVSTSATADDHDEKDYDDDNDNDNGNDVDEPEGFEVNVLAEHATFTDDVSAMFTLDFEDYAEDDERPPIGVHMDDASSLIVAEVNWEEGARSGWHRHPGMSVINMVEGEIEVTWEFDCHPRTYEAGDAWVDPGHIHKADSDDGALAYLAFLGIPEGEPATEWVEPPDC